MSIRQRVQATVFFWFTENIAMKLLALCSAVAIWAWVQSEQVVTRRIRVQVNYAWPAGLVQVDEVPLRLVATVEGPQSVLLPLDSRELSMSVDLSGGLEGNNEVDFTIQPLNGLPQSLSVNQISPPGADIWLEEPMEKEVPVTLSSINAPPRGFELVNYTLDPPTVMVSGPKSQIQNIAQAPTDVIDLSNLQEDTTLEVPLTQVGMVQSLWEGPIQIRLDIEELISERTFTNVQVAVRGSGWTAETEQVQIRLQGPVRVLEVIEHSELFVVALVPEEMPAEQETLEMGYSPSDPSSGLAFVGFDTSAVTVTELSPPGVVLRRMPSEE